MVFSGQAAKQSSNQMAGAGRDWCVFSANCLPYKWLLFPSGPSINVEAQEGKVSPLLIAGPYLSVLERLGTLCYPFSKTFKRKCSELLRFLAFQREDLVCSRTARSEVLSGSKVL